MASMGSRRLKNEPALRSPSGRKKPHARIFQGSKHRRTQTILVVLAGRPWLTRHAVLGITSYAREHTQWELVLIMPEVQSRLPTLEQFHADGAIVGASPSRSRTYLDIPQPLVLMESPLLETSRPLVSIDNNAIGAMAAQYYLARGYRNLAYVPSGKVVSDGRHDGFVDALAKAGYGCEVLPHGMRMKDRDFGEVMDELRAWLESLPHPTGILTCNDQHGVIVLQACRLSGLRVPEELAVLGIHDDALYCQLGHVPLSSIAIAGEKMGYEAARMLDLQLQGKPIDKGHLYFPPMGVITRRSTDTLAVEDPYTQEALHWIGAHLHEPIDLEDLLDAVPMSRSSLERRFKQTLGRTPYEEVLRQRIERAKTLLVDTNQTMEQIALACGFSGRVYFGNAFKHHMKISPTAFRAQYVRPGTWR